jgi:acyl-CoA reductase-like NAD-dependent aldehyde dehydrogenase
VRRRCRPPARRARGAFYAWSHRPLAERIACVQRFAALLEAQKEALATLISRETSKPLWETRTEVQAMIGKARISIEAYTSVPASAKPRCRTVKRCCATNRTA